MSLIEQLKAKITRWRRDPVTMVREEFHTEPDKWQIEYLKDFADPSKQRLGQQACAGPGKTAVLAWCGWNFMACYADKNFHPNGAAMSVTSDNLKDNLWKEFAVWHSRSKFLQAMFEWTKERIFAKQHPSTWFISARSWSKNANPEEQGRTLSGLHSKYVLYLIDESGDISSAVLRSAEQGLSNCKWGKILQAGNPTSHTGILYQSATSQRHLWSIVRVTGDPDDPNRSSRIDREWAKQQIELYGRDNPWVMAYILGQFPPTSINSLLGPDEVEAAMTRSLRDDQYDFAQKRLGIDVARFGDDRTVIFPRQGLVAFEPVEMRGARTTDIAARVMKAKASWGSEMEFIDDTGHWGHGVIDNLLAAGYSPLGIQFHGPAIDPRYKNRRAEMWIEMAEWVKRGGCLPNIPSLVGELTIPTYTFANGKFLLEDKDLIKKRLGRSPDLADALALTFSIPDMPSEAHIPPSLRKAGRFVSEYDPFDDEEARRRDLVGVS